MVYEGIFPNKRIAFQYRYIQAHVEWHYMFLFITGMNSEDGLPFSTNISSRTDDLTFPISCNGRCSETRSRFPILECKCDNECMFLGDCCYDYLVECDPRNLDLSTAHQEQISTFHQFDDYSSCVDIRGEDDSNKSSKVVNLCPLPHDTDLWSATIREANHLYRHICL